MGSIDDRIALFLTEARMTVGGMLIISKFRKQKMRNMVVMLYCVEERYWRKILMRKAVAAQRGCLYLMLIGLSLSGSVLRGQSTILILCLISHYSLGLVGSETRFVLLLDIESDAPSSLILWIEGVIPQLQGCTRRVEPKFRNISGSGW